MSKVVDAEFENNNLEIEFITDFHVRGIAGGKDKRGAFEQWHSSTR